MIRTMTGLLPSVLAAVAMAGAAAPNAPAKPAPPEAPWSIAEPVMVTAPAPRLWKLVRGGATVWVLGEISPLPKGLVWNSAPLTRVMQGADRVLLPPEGSVGVWDGLGALVRSRLPSGATLGAALPPELDRRYRAVLARLGRNPDKTQRDKPAWAALFLELDFMRSPGVDASEPLSTLQRMARARHIPVQRMATYRRTGVLNELVGLPEGEGEATLSDAVEGVEFGLDHVTAAGQAWAKGDLKSVRANISPDETPLIVLLHTPAGRLTYDRAVDDTTDALRSALGRPGVTVAVMRLAALVQQGGALDRLRAEGVEVSEPPL
jgi:hypothetical protein